MKWGFLVIAVIFAITSCMTAPQSAEGKIAIKNEADAALAKAQTADPTLTHLIRDSYGYAVFPSVGKAGFVFGGAYGQGILYEHGVFVGYCDMSQASIGFQLGGQTYTEIIVFANKEAVNQFKTGNFAFDAQASAVALKSGASANAKYSAGVAIFTMDETGLMYEASVGGQKFSYQAR
jgi:lipid-binding SYLF domain-containing protein